MQSLQYCLFRYLSNLPNFRTWTARGISHVFLIILTHYFKKRLLSVEILEVLLRRHMSILSLFSCQQSNWCIKSVNVLFAKLRKSSILVSPNFSRYPDNSVFFPNFSLPNTKFHTDWFKTKDIAEDSSDPKCNLYLNLSL